jgi:hypothetical protein
MEGNLMFSLTLPEFRAFLEQTVRQVLNERPIVQDQLLNSEQVMKLLNISVTTLQKWRNTGKIPFTRVDNKIFYTKSEVLSAIGSRQDQPENL